MSRRWIVWAERASETRAPIWGADDHEDGSEGDIGPGEAYVIEPGHDAWVVGDEAFVGFEFESPTAEVYAKG